MGSAHEMRREDQCGGGATSEVMLEPLMPLSDYYTREMGELPGRLMMALGFLDDAQLTASWSTQTPEARQAVEQARALVVSVMIRLLNAQERCGCEDTSALAAEVQGLLDLRTESDRNTGR